MQCTEIRERLDAWVDGELPSGDAKMVRSHVAQCPGCRRQADAVHRIAASLDALPAVPAPAGFAHRALRAFRAGIERPGMAAWWRGLSPAMRGAVCGTVLAGLLCGAILAAGMTSLGTGSPADPYQTLYASRGIAP